MDHLVNYALSGAAFTVLWTAQAAQRKAASRAKLVELDYLRTSFHPVSCFVLLRLAARWNGLLGGVFK